MDVRSANHSRPRLLTGMRGGEKCLEILCRAAFCTAVHPAAMQGSVGPIIGSQRIVTSFLQRFARGELLPLFVAARRPQRQRLALARLRSAGSA